jgi:hypothetical protein
MKGRAGRNRVKDSDQSSLHDLTCMSVQESDLVNISDWAGLLDLAKDAHYVTC